MLASSFFGARHTAETPRLVLEFADFWFFTPQRFASGWLDGPFDVDAAAGEPRSDHDETKAAIAPGRPPPPHH